MSNYNDDCTVYDLGDVSYGSKPGSARAASARVAAGGGVATAGAAAADHARPLRQRRVVVAALESYVASGRSLSVVLPGAGHLLDGRISLGLFFLSATGFLVALAWAILETLGRLSATLEALGMSRAGAVWALMALYGAAMMLHLANVVTAAVPVTGRGAHPVVAGAASALLPGWGQFLNGDRLRAVVFLGALWVAGAAWIVGSAWTQGLLDGLGLLMPVEAQAFGSPLARFTLPAVVWSLAIYDAAASAAHRR